MRGGVGGGDSGDSGGGTMSGHSSGDERSGTDGSEKCVTGGGGGGGGDGGVATCGDDKNADQGTMANAMHVDGVDSERASGMV